jgi:hypothetical protein
MRRIAMLQRSWQAHGNQAEAFDFAPDMAGCPIRRQRKPQRRAASATMPRPPRSIHD